MRRWIGLVLVLVLAVCFPAAAQLPARPVISPDNAAQIQLIAFLPDSQRMNALPVAWSPVGTTLAVARLDGIQLYDIMPDGIRPGLYIRADDSIRALTYSPDGALLAGSAGRHGAIWMWNAHTGALVATLNGGGDLVEALVFSPDNRLLASTTINAKVYLWGVPSQPFTPTNAYHVKRQKTLELDSPTFNLAFNAESTALVILVSSKGASRVVRWDLAAMSEKEVITVSDVFGGFAASPDESLIAIGGDSIYLWETTALIPRPPMTETSDQPVDVLALNPALTLLAAGYNDGMVRIWDLQTYSELIAFKHGTINNRVAFSSDGTLLASRGWYDGVRIWGLGGELKLLPAPTPTISLLHVGGDALVQTWTGDRLNARRGAGRAFDIVAKLASGTAVTIINGPQDADGFTWWQVRTADGVEGWVVERIGDEPTLLPMN